MKGNSLEFVCNERKTHDTQLIPVIADDGRVPQQQLLFDEDASVPMAELHQADGVAGADVQHHQGAVPGGHQQVMRQHEDARGVGVRDGNGVEQMTLKTLPHADLLVRAERDDVAGGVGERGHAAIVRLGAVHAGARRQVPHAQQPVLGTAAAQHGRHAVNEQAGNGAAVPVQGVQCAGVLQPVHLQGVVLAAGYNTPPLRVQHRYGLLVSLCCVQADAAQILWGHVVVQITAGRHHYRTRASRTHMSCKANHT